MITRESKKRRLDLHPLAAVVLVMVFATSALATISIPSDTSVGTWDSLNRIYTLTSDVSEKIEVDEDDLTLDGNGKTVTGSGSGSGVYLEGRTGVTIQNLNVEQFAYGIYLNYSDNNILTGNTANSNLGSGILLWDSINNTLTGNTANSNNERGISVWYSSNNILTGNVNLLNNFEGITLGYCSNHTLTNNTTSNNGRGIQFYWSSGNTLTGNTVNSNSYEGIWLLYSNNNILTGNTTSNNYDGIRLTGSSGNSLTGNTASNNYDGILLYLNCSNNTLTGNTVSWNSVYGIWLRFNSNGNQIYNNNFIGNSTQARVDGGSGNVFNLDWPIGGNYWSDWTGPDTNPNDGFVDSPYVIAAGVQDNLPWVVQNGWVPCWIQQLIDDVAAMDLQKGINNSLDAKLDAAFKVLDDVNANNDVAAIHALHAFINVIEVQRGNKISDADADVLIAAVNEIIAMLSSP